MKFWDKFKQIFTMPDLRNKILISLGLLLVARVLAHVPLPGVDTSAFRNFFGNNQMFGMLNMFSGGAMENFSIIMMGVGPYITASIIFQLLTMIIPSLDEINKDGESGRAKITQWTRYLSVPLAFVEGFAMVKILQGQGLIQTLSMLEWGMILISITAGTVFLMWIGELITEKGIGNGISLLIALGILAQIPTQLVNTAQTLDASMITNLIMFAIVGVLVVVGIILANEGIRQIPISYARRARGTKSFGAVNNYMPIRVNSAGVIPIIFAMSIMLFPNVIANFFKTARSEWLANAAIFIERLFNPNGWFYGLSYFLLVALFTYFYTGIIFKPDQMAENLQKQGGFIPGIRPGKETSSFLSGTITRLTLSGAIFLGLIAILPFIMQSVTKISTIVIGGTGVLIMVSVIIETMRQVQSQLVMRSYENY